MYSFFHRRKMETFPLCEYSFKDSQRIVHIGLKIMVWPKLLLAGSSYVHWLHWFHSFGEDVWVIRSVITFFSAGFKAFEKCFWYYLFHYSECYSKYLFVTKETRVHLVRDVTNYLLLTTLLGAILGSVLVYRFTRTDTKDPKMFNS